MHTSSRKLFTDRSNSRTQSAVHSRSLCSNIAAGEKLNQPGIINVKSFRDKMIVTLLLYSKKFGDARVIFAKFHP